LGFLFLNPKWIGPLFVMVCRWSGEEKPAEIGNVIQFAPVRRTPARSETVCYLLIVKRLKAKGRSIPTDDIWIAANTMKDGPAERAKAIKESDDETELRPLSAPADLGKKKVKTTEGS
jgi:hypothetical protein